MKRDNSLFFLIFQVHLLEKNTPVLTPAPPETI